MSRLIFLLFFVVVIMGGIAFAQGTSVEPSKEQIFWEQIDITSEWGKWFKSTIKPYFEKMSEVATTYIFPAIEIDITGLSPDEIMKKVNAGYVDYYKAIQSIIPSLELKAYHSKIVELFAETTKTGPMRNEELINKLGAEANQELVQVFTQHGVPQKIIDEFTKNL